MTAPPPAPPSAGPPGTAWTPEQPARPALRRSRSDKMAGGVAGGLAEYSGIDPLLWRVGFIALTFAGGTGILVYLLLWVLLPAAGPPPGAAPTDSGPAGRAPAALPRPALPRSPVGRLTLAGMLIAVGLLVLVARTTGWNPGPLPFLAVALLVVGAGLVAAAFVPGRTARGGLLSLGVVLSLALAVASVIPWTAGGGVGDRTYRPASVDQVQETYRLGVGDMTVDLSGIDVSDIDEPLRIRIEHGVGDLDVLVPRAADVRVDLDSGVGSAHVFDDGSSDGGFFPGTGSGPGVDDGEPEFVLTVEHGVGDVGVSRG